MDDEALLALDIGQARADAAAAAATAASSTAAACQVPLPPLPLPPQMMSAEERSQLQQENEQELKQLRRAHVQQKRDADTVTDEMYKQCKELLQLFGVPYIEAPTYADTYVPGPSYCTYGLTRTSLLRAEHTCSAGQLAPEGHYEKYRARTVATRTSLELAARTVYRGTAGAHGGRGPMRAART